MFIMPRTQVAQGLLLVHQSVQHQQQSVSFMQGLVCTRHLTRSVGPYVTDLGPVLVCEE